MDRNIITQDTVEELKGLQDAHRKWIEEQFDTKDERIRTLEDALRPFAEECDTAPMHHGHRVNDPDNCATCSKPWPCKYETARRALEGEG